MSYFSLLRAVLLAGFAVLAPAVATAADSDAAIWLTNARVLTGTDAGTVTGATVHVADGRVIAVGADLQVPEDANVVDAAGAWVTPGFIDSDSRLGVVEIEMVANTVDAAVLEYPMGPAFDVQYALNSRSVLIPAARAAGVTRAIVAPAAGNDPLAGWGAAVQLGAGSAFLSQPQLAMFGNIGTGGAQFVGGSRSALLVRLRASLTAARRYSAGRAPADRDAYTQTDMQALKAWLASDTPLVLHVNQASQIEQALALAEEFRLRLIISGGAEAWRVAAQLAAAEVPVVLDPMANLPSGFDRLGSRLDNAALLHAAGVNIVFTAGGAHNGGWLRQGAGISVANGLPYDAAIAAITATPARIWGLENVGTVSPGQTADLVLWSGDPLEVTSHAQRVMIGGAWQSTETRANRLRDRYRDLLNTSVPFGYR